jgi:hypothetical protein
MHNHPSNLALELIKDINQNLDSNPPIHIFWAFHLGLRFVVFSSRILQQCFLSMFVSKVLRQWKEMLLVHLLWLSVTLLFFECKVDNGRGFDCNLEMGNLEVCHCGVVVHHCKMFVAHATKLAPNTIETNKVRHMKTFFMFQKNSPSNCKDPSSRTHKTWKMKLQSHTTGITLPPRQNTKS